MATEWSDNGTGPSRRLNMNDGHGSLTPPPPQTQNPAAFSSPELRSPSRAGGTVRKPAAAAVASAHQQKQFQQLKSEAQAWEQRYKTIARDNVDKDLKIKEMQDIISKLEASKAAALKAKAEGEQHTMRNKSMESRNRELQERLEAMRATAAERESELTHRVQDLEQAAAKWMAYGEDAARKMEEFRAACTSFDQANRGLQDDLSKLHKCHADTSKALQSTKEDLQRATVRSNELTEANAKLLAELRVVEEAKKELTAARERDEAHLFRMHEVEQRLSDELASTEKRLRAAEERLLEQAAVVKDEKERRATVESRVADLQQAVQRAEDDKLQVAARLDESQREVDRLRASLEAAAASAKHQQILIDQCKGHEQSHLVKYNKLSEEAAERSKELAQLKFDHSSTLAALKKRDHDVALLEAQLVTARHEAEQARSQAASVRREVGEAAAEAAHKVLSVEQQRQAYAEEQLKHEQEVAMLRADLNRLQLELEHFKLLAEQSQKRAEEALSDAGNAVDTVKETVSARHRAETEVTKKTAIIAELEGRLAQLQQCVTATSESLAEASALLETERGKRRELEGTVNDLRERLEMQEKVCDQLSAAKEQAALDAATAEANLRSELSSYAARYEQQTAQLVAFLGDELHLHVESSTMDGITASLRVMEAQHRATSETHTATAAKLKTTLSELETARSKIDCLERSLAATAKEASDTGRRALSLENQLSSAAQRAALEYESLQHDVALERRKVEQLRRDLATVQQQLAEGRDDAMQRFDEFQKQLQVKEGEVVRARSESHTASIKSKTIIAELQEALQREQSTRAAAEASVERLQTALHDAQAGMAHESSRHKAYKEALEQVKTRLAKSQDCRRTESAKFHERANELIKQRDSVFKDFDSLVSNYKDLVQAFRCRGGNVDRDLGAEHSERVSQCILTTERSKKAASTQRAMVDELATAAAESPCNARDSNVLAIVASNRAAERSERKSVSFDPRPARCIGEHENHATDGTPNRATSSASKRLRSES